MRIRYDPKVDALSIKLSDSPYAESDEVRQDVIFDYDRAGKLIGIELLHASKVLPKEFRGQAGVSSPKLTQRSS